MRLFPILIVALSALALSSPAAGQVLQPGTRVRVSAPIIRGNSRFVGNVVSSQNSRLLLRLDPTIKQDTRLDTISIPRELIRRVEVSLGAGRPSRAPAARAGAIAGLLAGVAIGLAVGGNNSIDKPARNPWTTAAWVGPLTAVVGAGTGALIGQGAHEEWRTVPAANAVAAGAQNEGALKLGLSLKV
jgi:hypothetical protein